MKQLEERAVETPEEKFDFFLMDIEANEPTYDTPYSMRTITFIPPQHYKLPKIVLSE